MGGMGFVYRRHRSLGRNVWLNLSKSGASASGRVGPLTVNSRGRVSFRILPGLFWRSGK